MRLAELLPDTLIPLGSADFDIAGVTDDLQQVRSGFMFFDLSGTNGARYWQDAVRRGARVLIVDSHALRQGLGDLKKDDLLIFAHSDVRSVHRRVLARLQRMRSPIVVAVADMRQQSSTAAFIQTIWEAAGHGVRDLGSSPSHIVQGSGSNGYAGWATAGSEPTRVVLFPHLAGTATHFWNVANHRFEWDSLCHANLDVLVVGSFPNRKNETNTDFVSTGFVLAQELPQRGAAIVSIDHPVSAAVARQARKLQRPVTTFSARGLSADLMLLSHDVQEQGQVMVVSLLGETHQIEIPTAEGIDAEGAVAAIGAAIAAGTDVQSAARAAEYLRPAPRRRKRQERRRRAIWEFSLSRHQDRAQGLKEERETT